MNYRGTRLSVEVMRLARAAAHRLGHGAILPDHLILGLLEVRDGVASSVFDALGVDREEIRGVLERRLPAGRPTPAAEELPFDGAGVAILEDWMAEADREGVTRLTTGHLLIAVFENEAWPGDAGFGLEELRKRVEQAAAASTEREDVP